ncbi:MAG: ATP-binding protein [Deltaproteobacteria bacterium]|nr:ATP-binding protein [Deltaproteobacteria bacterium]
MRDLTLGELRAEKTVLDDQTVELNLPSKLGFERIAIGGLAAFAKGVGFSSSRIEDLKTSVAEACINAVQHGNKGKPNARVLVSISFQENALCISVFDEGEGFKTQPKDPDIERIMENLDPPIGFGIFLMKRLMDEVDFNRTSNHRHEVRMMMKLTG